MTKKQIVIALVDDCINDIEREQLPYWVSQRVKKLKDKISAL